MNKRSFVRCVTDKLRDNGDKKPVSIPKQTFTISDNEGNKKTFTVKHRDKTAIYTIDDVEKIVDAALEIICESLQKGEPISFQGFGSLSLKYRKPRETKMIGTDETRVVPGKYVPKFYAGNDLKLAAKLFEISLDDGMQIAEPVYDETDMIVSYPVKDAPLENIDEGGDEDGSRDKS